jgi:hypothetical protein
MRTFKFFNPQNTLVVDVETDAISTTNDNLTVHDINYIAGVEFNAQSCGFSLQRKESSRTALHALATAANLSLTEIDAVNNSSSVVHAATALAIANTTPLAAAAIAVAPAYKITCPNFAGTDQGDHFILTNKAGVTFAVWYDKDAAGVLPTGTLFAHAKYKIKVPIVTGGSAIANAGLTKTAIEATTGWAGFTTITAVGDGTLTLSGTDLGSAPALAYKNSAETGVGKVVAELTTPGSGDYSVQLTTTGGNGKKTFTKVGALPTGYTLSASGLISGASAANAVYSVVYTVTDELGGTASKTLVITLS